MRGLVGVLGACGLVVGAFATPEFVGTHFTAHGHVTEVVYVTVLRATAGAIGALLGILALAASDKLLSNALLLVVAIGVSFGMLEGVLRVVDLVGATGPTAPTGLRASRDAELVYENTPNFVEDGVPIFNSLGLRDEERPIVEGRTHIVVVGDSIESWRALPVRALYPRVLEDMLNASRSEPVETINLGVTGYSLHQKVEMLRYRGLAWHPKLVIAAYCLNDPIPAWELIQHFTAGSAHPFTLRSVELINTRVRTLLHGYGLDFYSAIHRPDGASWQGVEKDLAALGRVQSSAGFRAIVVIFPLMSDTARDYPWLDIHRRVAETARKSGLVVVDLLDPYHAAGFPQVRADGVHPNELGHRIAAEQIDAVVEREHLLTSTPPGPSGP